MDKDEDIKVGGKTTYSYSDDEIDQAFCGSKGRVLVIEQKENRIILNRRAALDLSRYTDKWKVK